MNSTNLVSVNRPVLGIRINQRQVRPEVKKIVDVGFPFSPRDGVPRLATVTTSLRCWSSPTPPSDRKPKYSGGVVRTAEAPALVSVSLATLSPSGLKRARSRFDRLLLWLPPPPSLLLLLQLLLSFLSPAKAQKARLSLSLTHPPSTHTLTHSLSVSFCLSLSLPKTKSTFYAKHLLRSAILTNACFVSNTRKVDCQKGKVQLRDVGREGEGGRGGRDRMPRKKEGICCKRGMGREGERERGGQSLEKTWTGVKAGETTERG